MVIDSQLYTDSDVPAGQIDVLEGPWGHRIHMQGDTLRALFREHGRFAVFFDIADWVGLGRHRIPQHFLDRDLDRNVSLLGEIDAVRDGEPAWVTCVIPGCLQDPVDDSRGYRLCSIHVHEAAEWDRLTA